MRSYFRYLRTGISLVVAVPMIGVPAMPSFAQAPPSCPPGTYYASDGYCYPQPQPSYSPPPPVYDPGPPSYQSSSSDAVAGVAIGVGLGLLVGALAANSGNQRHAPPARGPRGPRDRGHR
jgi:hypothetical protein